MRRPRARAGAWSRSARRRLVRGRRRDFETVDILAMPADRRLPSGALRRLPSRDTRDEATSWVIHDPSRAREAHPRVYPPTFPSPARCATSPPRPRPGKPPVPAAAETAVAEPSRSETFTIAVPVTTFAAGAASPYSPRSAPASGSCHPAGKSSGGCADKLNLVQRRATSSRPRPSMPSPRRRAVSHHQSLRRARVGGVRLRRHLRHVRGFVYETIIRTAAPVLFSPRTSTSRARRAGSPRAASKRDRVGARTPPS